MIQSATLDDVRAAETRLKDLTAVTPCPYSETLSVLTGSRVFVKLENLQMTGSFKEHGVANILLALYGGKRRHGVVALSAGNHGLAVAFRAARLGVRSVIVMPEWAPLTKVTAARRHGAEVILHGNNYGDSYERGREIVTEHGLIFIHPFDDLRVIAGQSTIALRSPTSVSGSKARRLSCCSAGATSTATSSPASSSVASSRTAAS